jgi:hypothetical protein
LIKGLRNERPGHSTIGTTTSGWSNCGRREQVKAKITSLIWQVLDLNFSQPNFLRMQDPFGHGVRASKKPYNAFLLVGAGLGSWSQFKTNVAIFSS